MQIMPFFETIKDHRRKEGRQYDLPHVLLFTLLAILSDAHSYRKIATFIKIRFPLLKQIFGIKWRKAPGYTTVRDILLGVNEEFMEQAFRSQAKVLADLPPEDVIAIDGKMLRGSFDHQSEQPALMMLSAFATSNQIILGHIMLNEKEKESEIPAAQLLINQLNLNGKLFTLDALHCQKKQ